MAEHRPLSETSTDPASDAGSVSPFRAGFMCRCPGCGKGPVFDGLLSVRETCGICGFDLRDADPGDGPAVFVIFILGAIATILALSLDAAFSMPLWLLMAVMSVVIFGGAIWMLRIMKALLIALQFHNDAREMRVDTKNKDEQT